MLTPLRAERAPARAREALVDAFAVAEHLGVTRSFVYEHADELGAVRLGLGPPARLRFSLAEVDERLTTCPAGRQAASPASEPIRRRRRPVRSGTGVELLPIRGVGAAS